MSGIVVLNTHIKELLIENKKTPTLNHEDALKSIHDKIAHVSGPLLKSWTVMEKEKQIAMEHIDSQNGDTNPQMELSTLFEQSIFAFNIFCSLDTLVDGKSKVKDILNK